MVEVNILLKNLSGIFAAILPKLEREDQVIDKSVVCAGRESDWKNIPILPNFLFFGYFKYLFKFLEVMDNFTKHGNCV